jgi:hypothetical protein
MGVLALPYPAHPGESRDPGRTPGPGYGRKKLATENTENTDVLKSTTGHPARRDQSVLSVLSVVPLQRLPAWVLAFAGMSGGLE